MTTNEGDKTRASAEYDDSDVLAAMDRASVVGLAVFDAGLRFVWVNAGLAAMHKTTAEKHLGRRLEDIVPQVATALTSQLRKVLTTCVPVLGETLLGVERHVAWDIVPIGPPGAPTHLVTLVVEVTGRVRAELALAERLRLSNVVSEISARLIDRSPADADEGILDVLHAVAEPLDIDRAYVCLFASDRATYSCSHQWTRDGVPRTAERYRRVSVERFPWAISQLLAGDVVAVHHPAELPDEANPGREALGADGTRSARARLSARGDPRRAKLR